MHITTIPSRSNPAALILGLVLAFVLAVPALPARAQDSGLAILEAGSALVEGRHVVSARIDYRLSREALEALQNGVPLTFEVLVELSAVRRWWFDGVVVDRRQVSRLSYDPLSQSYVVRDDRDDAQRSFTTLYAALKDLGRVEGLVLVEDEALAPDTEYEVAIRAALDQARLPGPLKLLAFWQDGLNLDSEWYRWRLDR